MNTKELEKILKILASKRRLDIISLLKYGKKMPLSDIAREIKLSRKSTSKHLRILYSTDFVEREFKGQEVYYSLGRIKDKLTKNIMSQLK